MTNIYNKGTYRNGEWAKHLRPFLKRTGNQKWRRTASKEVDEALEVSATTYPKQKRKQTKAIMILFKVYSHGDKTSKYTARYRTLKDAQKAMTRNRVIDALILKN